MWLSQGDDRGSDTASVPDWSGQFFEFEQEDLGMMLVSNADERQHRPPLGWEPIHHSTSEHGEFEVFTFRRLGLS
jgi:hypothetical protein